MADTSGALALAAGVSAVTLELIGVDARALIVAIAGAACGLTVASSIGRWRALMLFPAVAVGAALLGSWAASWPWTRSTFGDGPGAKLGLIFLCGVGMHAALTEIPALMRGAADRLGAKR